MKTIKTILILLICLLLPLIIGGVSGYATAAGIKSWYLNLIKPSFNPPNYLFGPVWTFLYLLMGISLFLIWRAEPGKERTNSLVIFTIQISLNFLWSFLFFKFNLLGIAFIEIILIWLSIVCMILIFRRVNQTAAYLQIPYLLWVSFASVLNGYIWFLN